MKRLIVVLALFSVFLFSSCGPSPQRELTQKIRGEGKRRLTLTVAPETLWVGVPIHLALEIDGERDDDVVFTDLSRWELPESLVLTHSRADDNRLDITLRAEKPGSYTLPPLWVLFENPAGNREMLTRPLELSVVSLVGEEGERTLSPNAGPMKIGFLPLWLVLVIGGSFLAAGIILFWLLYRRRRGRIIREEPIWVQLEREREALKRDPHLLDGDRGRFYDVTGRLVRKALDGVYGQSTRERTREEFMTDLVESDLFQPERKLWFSRFFERADLVRFAKADADREAALADLDEVFRFARDAAETARAAEEETES